MPGPNDPSRSEDTRNSGGRIFGAVLLIVAGIALFLSNLGVFSLRNIWQLWPLFMIAWGAKRMFESSGRNQRSTGAVIMVVGAFLLCVNLGVFHFHDSWSWIVGFTLLAIGVAHLLDLFPRWHWTPNRRPNSPREPAYPNGQERHIVEKAVFGSAKRRVESAVLESAHLQAVFGSVELDLRLAAPAAKDVRFHVQAVYGAIKLRIPQNWRLLMRVDGAFGAAEDKTVPIVRTDESSPTIIVTGNYAFGAVEVEN